MFDLQNDLVRSHSRIFNTGHAIVNIKERSRKLTDNEIKEIYGYIIPVVGVGPTDHFLRDPCLLLDPVKIFLTQIVSHPFSYT